VVQKKDISKDRLLIVYEPLLKLLKNRLYSYQDTEDFHLIIKQAAKIIENNRAFVGNDVYGDFELFLNCSEQKKKKYYEIFCNRFLSSYNKLCKYVGIPKIDIYYRYQHNWYDRHGKISFILKSTGIALLQSVLAFVILIILITTLILILGLFGIIPMTK